MSLQVVALVLYMAGSLCFLAGSAVLLYRELA